MAAVAPAGQRIRTKNPLKLYTLDADFSDTLYLSVAVPAFRVNAAGTVKFTVKDTNGDFTDITRTFAAGEIWRYGMVYRIFSTGTSASGLDAVFS